jgi:MFS family permease
MCGRFGAALVLQGTTQVMDVTQAPSAPLWREQFEKSLLAPIRALRPSYLPLLMVFFAYGATGLWSIASAFWVRKSLTWGPAELSGLAVWFGLPWTIKMVFGELVDTVPLLGSQRRSYVFAGAALVATSLILLAGSAGGWITAVAPDHIYVIANLLSVAGLVLQNVVADAMSTEVVPRTNPDGTARAQAEIDRDLGMVQVLGRLALTFGVFAVAGLGGLLAQVLSYDQVFLIGLIVPLISISGAVLVRLETTERRPTDWRILGGGLAFGALVAAIGLSQVSYSQEIVFALSMAVVIWMLVLVTRDIDHATRVRIALAAIIIFAFRATPLVGDGLTWFEIDVLGFTEGFFGVLSQIGAGVAIAALWFLSDLITRKPVAQVLLWLAVLGTIMSLPMLVLVFQWYGALGVSPHAVALFETIAASPFADLSMIPVLTLIAIYAPAGRRATWFALMASLMNLALQAGALLTKYLNLIFHIGRGDYASLPALTVTVMAIGLLLPLAAIAVFGRRIR